MYFSLIQKAIKEEVEDVPTKVVDLLDEFQDIVSDNVPNRFLLVRKTDDQTYVIPITSLSSKEAHKITLTRSKELNKEVHELL